MGGRANNPRSTSTPSSHDGSVLNESDSNPNILDMVFDAMLEAPGPLSRREIVAKLPLAITSEQLDHTLGEWMQCQVVEKVGKRFVVNADAREILHK